MEKRVLRAQPPQDIELGLPRTPLEYFVVPPSSGIQASTGLVFFIAPWGMDPAGEYVLDKLLPFLADRLDCLAVSLRYHGIDCKLAPPNSTLVAPPGWFEMMHQTYGTPLSTGLDDVFADLERRGITELNPNFILLLRKGMEHQSWGFLPALDHIAVLGELLAEVPLNPKRLLLMGSSYGGYVANLLVKIMPNTFSAAVDNSGFTAPIPKEMAPFDFRIGSPVRLANGIKVTLVLDSPWVFTNPKSPRFFKPAYYQIRDLNVADHMRHSETHVICYHSPEDSLAPYADKHAYCTMREAYGPTDLVTVREEDIDHTKFKSMKHGMQASLRELFMDAAGRLNSLDKARDANDFSEQSRVEFDCGELNYRFSYERDYTFTVHTEP